MIPLQGPVIDAWWFDEEKATALSNGQTKRVSDTDPAASKSLNINETDVAAEKDSTLIIVSISIIGVVLLLWSSVRRRNRS